MLIVNKLDKSGKPLNELAKNGNSVNKIYRNGEVVFQKLKNEEEAPSPLKMPLAFNITSNGTINWTASDTSVAKTIEYKLNNTIWRPITSNTTGAAITVNVGDKIQFRGNNTAYSDGLSYNTFGSSTAEFEVEGNIMSLIYGDNFKNNSTISSTCALAGLFRDCTNLVSAENLILPATTLANRCYYYMFEGCSSLTTAPELPATTLQFACYSSMFKGCSNLRTAPALPSTALEDFCYNNMFYNCTSLTTAPELPATTLKFMCYSGMFYGCTSLNYIKCLATDISASDCTSVWVNGVASTGTFVKAASMNDWTTGNNGIPSGWTIENNS